MPEPFGYFAVARVSFGGQEVVITRTGYTNELGWEFYTEPHHDADALWAHLEAAGEPHGMEIFGLDAMNIRRIEAGILNAGSDFNTSTTPYDAGLGRFVDEDKGDFIGKSALKSASRAVPSARHFLPKRRAADLWTRLKSRASALERSLPVRHLLISGTASVMHCSTAPNTGPAKR